MDKRMNKQEATELLICTVQQINDAGFGISVDHDSPMASEYDTCLTPEMIKDGYIEIYELESD